MLDLDTYETPDTLDTREAADMLDISERVIVHSTQEG